MGQTKRADRTSGKKRRKIRPFRLRVRIVAACHLREVTPKEIAARERLEVAAVQYHFGALEKEGWIHVSRRERARGGVRHYYTADRLKLITDREFKQMTDQERHETSEGVLMDFLEVCRAAHEEGTLDADPDSHLSQNPMELDKEAWDGLQSEMDRWLERVLEFKVEAAMRLRKSGEKPIPTVATLAAFRIPNSVIEVTKARR